MKPTRKLCRRSFFKQVGGGVVTIGATALISTEALAWHQEVMPPDEDIPEDGTGITDSDTGTYSDNENEGRGNVRNQPAPRRRRTGITDQDRGTGSDQPQYGRGGHTGFSDRDRGANADPSGRGRGTLRNSPRSGYSDSDSGEIRDRPGHGVREGSRTWPRTYTGRNDGDPIDPDGYGRGPSTQPVRPNMSRPDGQCVFYTGVSDTDSGSSRDPSNYGRAWGWNRC